MAWTSLRRSPSRSGGVLRSLFSGRRGAASSDPAQQLQELRATAVAAIGRSVVLEDRLDPARVHALHVTLSRTGSPPGPGAELPPFWHWAHFWDIQPAERLGRDGHPRPGTGLIPDTGLPRRMWAGGRLTWHKAALVIGEKASREITVRNVAFKQGRQGPMCFVTLHHRFRNESGQLALEEEQDLVYLEDPDPASPAATPRAAPTNELHREVHTFGPTALFRYSALTFNGHRIHYDLDYCRHVEGYANLVVHGPILGQLLIHMAAEKLPTGLRSFNFRAVAPVLANETFETCCRPEGDGMSLWVRNQRGSLAMTAEAVGH